MEEFDLAIIGAGPGGYVAALRAAKLGLKTVCIDKRQTLGGTCLNVGCIPSKALLESSDHLAFIKKHAKEHGIEALASVNFDFMMKRKEDIVQGLVKGIEGLFLEGGVSWRIGEACFLSPYEIEVNGDHLRAKHIIIATGSSPIELPFLPFDETQILSSTGCLNLKEIPKDLIVIGAGVIGLELASVYSRLGTQVTIVEMLDRICPSMDKKISSALMNVLKKQGLTFHLLAQVKSAEFNNRIKLHIEQKDRSFDLSAEKVLVAVGRRPYTSGLRLDLAKIQTDKKGFIPIDGNFKTSSSHIFAIGDVVEGTMLAHRAQDEGVAVVDLIAGNRHSINYMAIPNVIYTNPEVAAVGLTEDEAFALNLEVVIGTSYFKANPRARCSGNTDGFVKMIGEKKSGHLIGLHIIGSHASEMIGEGVLAIEKKMTIKEIAHASHAHPTLSESIKEAAESALRF